MGTFSTGTRKRGGEWQNAISLSVYSFWTWCSTGREDPYYILIIPFIESRLWAEQSRALGMCACGAGSQVWKILKQRPETRSHWCVLCGLHCFEKWLLSVKSCLSPWNFMGCSPIGSSLPGISQARIQKWVVISFSRHRGCFSTVKLFCMVLW